MKSDGSIGNEARIRELERIVKEFQEKFQSRTTETEEFITMTEIECMWSELRNKTDNIYSEMVCELLSTIDEGELIREKKRNTVGKE